mmetsp:Transcript_85886/g.268733  ORF Transcript_85886/g.268733 Transcript_85886/m.268733 type:complete len:289 (+) Transcript_85886:93-959(+)
MPVASLPAPALDPGDVPQRRRGTTSSTASNAQGTTAELPKPECSLPPTPTGQRHGTGAESDEDYDPRRPEYVHPATAVEELEGNIRIVRRQIKHLENAVHARQGREPLPGILRHYERMIAELRQSEGKQSKAMRLLRGAPADLQVGSFRPQRSTSISGAQPSRGGGRRSSISGPVQPMVSASPSRPVRWAGKECHWLGVCAAADASRGRRGPSPPRTVRCFVPASPKAPAGGGELHSPVVTTTRDLSVGFRSKGERIVAAWQANPPPSPPSLRSPAAYARFQGSTRLR